jgi:hypothetical protein
MKPSNTWGDGSMKRYLLFSVMLIPVLLIGCGGDDNKPVDSEPDVTRITAAEPATSPAAVNAAVWSGITATSVAIPASGVKFKRTGSAEPASTASTVSVKAAVFADTLYMRVTWSDATFSAWPSAWRVHSLVGQSPLFEHLTTWSQDQLVLLFSGLTSDGWDVWHWQVHSTSLSGTRTGLISGFAEGKTLRNRSLITHTGDLEFVIENHQYGGFIKPTFLPEDYGGYSGFILPEDAVDSVEIIPDSGWTVGDTIPGYLTDTTAAYLTPQERGSRWSVNARALYETGQYTVLLSRAMTTAYTDDLNFTSPDSVTMRIGISNNFDFTYSATQGSSEQGFTGTFILVLP